MAIAGGRLLTVTSINRQTVSIMAAIKFPPYPSATHNNHYLNHYTNKPAQDDGKYEQTGVFPVAALIAKGSVARTQTGGILLGPLF